MRSRQTRKSTFIVLLAAILISPRETWSRPINIGSASPDQPIEEIRKFLPLADYLAAQLKAEGFDKGKVVVAKDIHQMAGYLREGKVDLYIDSPFPVLAVSRLSGSTPLLRRWKKGLAEYHSVIFTKRDTGISRPEDLKGKIIAFEKAYSSSGYFFPKIALAGRGLKLTPKKGTSEPVGRGEVGYVFSLHDVNTLDWVAIGKVSAGVTDNQTYLKEAGAKADRFTVIQETFPVPRQIVSFRAGFAPALLEKLKEILLKMNQSEEGRKALRDFEQTTKFDGIPGRSMAQLSKLAPAVDSELGLK